MTWRGVFFLACGLLLAAETRKEATDQAAIQGTWKITTEVENGRQRAPARFEKTRVRFTADKMIVTEGKESHGGTYKLDPAKKPATIVVTPDDGPSKGKPGRGIYQLEGDKLQICLTLQAGKQPPTDFSARADSGRVLLTLERVKP